MKFNTRTVVQFISAMSFVFLAPTSFAQEGENLVPNGSFESIGKKPKRLGKIESATGWVSPTGVRADLFVETKIPEIGVPDNAYGQEDPQEGDNYIGVTGFSYGNKVARSYVMTKLEAPMKKGMKYCVKMFVSLAEASKYASNNMGVMFSKKQFGTESKVSIIEDASIVHLNNDYETISARYDWTEICGTYTAKGGEKYITLGNFASNDETRFERMKKDAKTKDIRVKQVISAYYYIDDVSVRLLDQEKGQKCDCLQEDAGDAYSTLIYQKSFIVTEEMTAKEKVDDREVYFAFGKSKLSAEGKSSLDFIAKMLEENPNKKLQILGHNNAAEDEVGAEKSVYADMDNNRIGVVMKYLMEKGISESRMVPTRKGSKETQEHGEMDDDETKQAKNRRVTFVLL
ncbi:MAG: OmpA family protein [Crocinitomicaceae bacterium]|nr:OmpA family protein [Crocinitomicaceae bacterium]